MSEHEIVPVGPGPEEDEQVHQLDVEITERCKYLRTLICELQRIAAHLVGLASTALELGAALGNQRALTAFLGLLPLVATDSLRPLAAKLQPRFFVRYSMRSYVAWVTRVILPSASMR